MYHHHSQQQGPPQPFSDRPRPSHHQQQPDQQQSLSVNDMLSPVMGYQFPRPTQLPEELESALAIRGSRDMDHRLMDRQNQQQSSGPGGYSSNPGRGLDWSNYPPSNKIFNGPQSNTTHQCQRQQVPQQQPQSSHSEAGMHSWNAHVTDTHSPQAQVSHLSGNGSNGKGGVDGKGLYTQESAGSILASFGLSNEDLEVLSHYPDDQLTPDTLPFILRDIQVNKSQVKKNAGSSLPSTTYSQRMSHNISNMPPRPSRSSPLKIGHSHSPEVPSLLSVTQTAGKVIDYGHASRTTDESCGKETFKREPLSSERKVKMVYPPLSSSLAPKKNVEMHERRQVRLETLDTEHGDVDYRKSSSNIHKSKRSPVRESHSLSKSHRLDQDYRRVTPKSSSSSKTRNESSNQSKSYSSVPKPHSSTKRLPTPTMISDFSGDPPKVYPHTCSLCHIQCDQAKDWHDHINTVAHTAARRELRRKYNDWKPISPRRDSTQTQDGGSRTPWHATKGSPSHSISHSISSSSSLSPPLSKVLRKHGRSYSPLHRPHHYHTGSAHDGRKRPHDDSEKRPIVTSRALSSVSASKLGQRPKIRSSHLLAKAPAKAGIKPFSKTLKAASTKTDAAANAPPAKKKKKKTLSPVSQSSAEARLVHLTGIPKDATKQKVSDLVGPFGKTSSVTLMPACEEKEGENISGQKALVCMIRAEDAQALSQCTSLFIGEHQITAFLPKKPEKEKPLPDLHTGSGDATKASPASETPGSEANQTPPNKVQLGIVFISGLPESGCSESDIIKLAEPFGVPCEVIIAPEFGKALVWLPNMETADEMLKVNSFTKVKIKDSELKMSVVKQDVSLDTPVALYNLLKRPLDTSEPPSPVGWSSLLVIRNVPKTLTGPSEVRKLVERFGTIRNSLVLNKNMIICEMATAAMALAVSKRFQKYPCIIQNHPLYFTREADPKPITQNKVTTAYLDLPKTSDPLPAAGKMNSKHSSGESTLTSEQKESEKEDKKTENETCKELKKDGEVEKAGGEPSDISPAQEVKLEVETETTTIEPADDKPAEKKAGNNNPGPKRPEASSCDSRITSSKSINPQKVTPEMVEALLEECRTRSTDCAGKTTAPPGGKPENVQAKTSSGEEHERGRPGEEKKDASPKNKGEEERRKEKEREAKRDKERKERERREREKREEERREKERRRRHREGSAGSRSSGRSEGSKRKRDGHDRTTVTGQDKMVVEDCDEFPFDLDDFVTIDEVGDVTDIPDSLPLVAMETSHGGSEERADKSQDTSSEIPPESVQEDTTRAKPIAVATHTPESVPVVMATHTPDKPESVHVVVATHTPESVPVDMATHTPESVPVDMATHTPDKPESVHVVVATRTPESVPVDMATHTPESVPVDMSAHTPESVPVVMATPTPESVLAMDNSEATPIVMATATPESASVVDNAEVTDSAVTSPAAKPEAPQEHCSSEGTATPAAQCQPEGPPAAAASLDSNRTTVDSPPTPDPAPAEGAPEAVPGDHVDTPPSPVCSVREDELEKEKELEDLKQDEARGRDRSSLPAAGPGLTTSPAATPEAPQEHCSSEGTATPAAQCQPEGPPAAAPAEGAPEAVPGDHVDTRPSPVCSVREDEKEKEKELEDLKQDEARGRDRSSLPAAGPVKRQSPENERNGDENSVKKPKTAPLLQFDPNNAVGLEFLVPKTGFYCKVCNRFFSGSRQAEISHCKTLKHYENLQKYLQTM